MLKDSFSIREAANHSGLTISMIDYLTRTKIILPASSHKRGRGKARQYSFSNLVMLRTLKLLLDKGISVARLRDAIKIIGTRYPIERTEVLIQRYLVTNGKWVFFRGPNDVLENLNNNGQYEFSFVVDVERVRLEVVSSLNRA